jgi:ABC-type multidrug transport system ATPase subunit
VLKVDRLGVRVGGRWAVRELSLACGAGEVVALVGANGAGKTTVLRALAGVLPIERGAVELAGRPLRGAARRRVGFVPEAADPPGHLTALELLSLVAALRGAELPDAPARGRFFPATLDDAALGSLSLGERRRVCLAAAQVGAPVLLLLDEPENGLDAGGLEMLIEALTGERARGAAILVATHDRALIAALGAREVQLAAG